MTTTIITIASLTISALATVAYIYFMIISEVSVVRTVKEMIESNKADRKAQNRKVVTEAEYKRMWEEYRKENR